ncbi:S-layer homology domain-containing protein, partial [Patescibacteria group bacterium]|nr:S-layer homology domain-containing protein [Patescibacteria group bacterium]
CALPISFGTTINTNPGSVFPDVTQGAWYYNYVVTAYNNSFINGYDSGYFGPADGVTRAQAAKMIVNFMGEQIGEPIGEQIEEPVENPIEEEEEPVEEEEEEVVEGTPAEANTASISEMNLLSGSSEQFVARYNFRGLYEGFNIQTLTVVNDVVGDNLGDDLSNSPAIKNITIKYPDIDGMLQTRTSSFSANGSVKFANLDFYAQRNEDTFLEIYADLNSFSEIGESLSGEVIRLGLQNVNNSTSTFKAVGAISSNTLTFGSGMLILSGDTPDTFVVRKSVPSFSINDTDSNLLNGENVLIGFTITADDAGSIGFGRITFDVSVSDSAGADLALSNFKFYRSSTYLDDEVNIYDATGIADVSPAGGGSISNGLSSVVVSFNEEETVSAGSSSTYYLKAEAVSVNSSDQISSRIKTDDQAAMLTGLTANNNENTGRIYVNGDATDGIFVNANDFCQTLDTARGIIWSDKSADNHSYPTINACAVTSGSGSYDWTNGYLLDVSSLPLVTISR